MAYSRWPNSRWYTYWHSDTDVEDALLIVDDGNITKAFSEKALKRNLEANINCFKGTPVELAELRCIMTLFMLDVEQERQDGGKQPNPGHDATGRLGSIVKIFQRLVRERHNK